MKSRRFMRLQSLHPPVPWHRSSYRVGDGDLVILLHGLWRSYLSMEKLAEHLNEEGFEVLNIPYPSFRLSMEEIVTRIHEELERVDTGKTLHFVTHSLGGVLARYFVDRHPQYAYGRAVMLAPPHQGSQVVDWLEGSVLLSLLGPAGVSLSSESMQSQKGKDAAVLDVLVFMGTKRRIPWLHHLLDDQNDGIVSVSSCILRDDWIYRTIDGDHTLIMQEGEVIEQTSQFLKQGGGSGEIETTE